MKKDINKKALKKVLIFLSAFVILLTINFLVWHFLPNTSVFDGTTVMGLAFLAMVPCFLADVLMPVVANIKFIPRYPLDGGRMHKDGQRVLGPGKSWNGLIGGTLLGFLVSALIAYFVYPAITDLVYANFADGETVLVYITKEDILGFVDVTKNPLKFYSGLFFLSLSAPIGDMIGSYYKRRKQVQQGDVFLFWDQNDFIIFGSIIAMFFFPFEWFHVVILLLITPVLTIGFSWLAFAIGKKDVPW